MDGGMNMKKTFWILICVLMVGLFWGCGDNYIGSDTDGQKQQDIENKGTKYEENDLGNVVKPDTTVSPIEGGYPTPLSSEKIMDMSLNEIAQYVRDSALCDESVKLNILTYSSDVWFDYLLGQNRFVRLGIDFGVFEHFENGVTLLQSLYYKFPEIQFRKGQNGIYYTAFASETGDCIYYFATEENQLRALVGYPVLIRHGERKQYADFQDLTVGCTFYDVLEIDQTMNDYYEMFYQHSTVNDNSLWANKTTLRFTTVHYLTDGILELGYGAIDEEGKLVITEIRYSPDYVLEDCRGREISYAINPLDMP